MAVGIEKQGYTPECNLKAENGDYFKNNPFDFFFKKNYKNYADLPQISFLSYKNRRKSKSENSQ